MQLWDTMFSKVTIGYCQETYNHLHCERRPVLCLASFERPDEEQLATVMPFQVVRLQTFQVDETAAVVVLYSFFLPIIV